VSETLRKAIARHPLASSLTAKQVGVLAECARRGTYAAGDLLLEEGRTAIETFLVTKGRVALELHVPGRGRVRIATVSEGEVVGWSWLATVNRWHFDARATEEVHAIVLDGKKVLAQCEQDPALGYQLLRPFLAIATARLEAMRVQLLDLYRPRKANVPWL
jgi:CRP-like cAMP-binding protein